MKKQSIVSVDIQSMQEAIFSEPRFIIKQAQKCRKNSKGKNIKDPRKGEGSSTKEQEKSVNVWPVVCCLGK